MHSFSWYQSASHYFKKTSSVFSCFTPFETELFFMTSQTSSSSLSSSSSPLISFSSSSSLSSSSSPLISYSSTMSTTSSTSPSSTTIFNVNNIKNHILEVLDFTNYLIWKTLFINILHCHQVYNHIDGTSSCPSSTITDADGNVTVNPAYQLWK